MRKQLGVSVELLEIAGVTVRKLTPKEVSPHFENHVYIDVHGGAYVFFGGLPSIEEGLLIASRLGITVLSVDYAMPPHAPAPAALCDLKAVYLALLDSVDSRRILVGGTSAGAGAYTITSRREYKPSLRYLYRHTMGRFNAGRG